MLGGVLPVEVRTAFGGCLPLAPPEYEGVLPKTVYGSRCGFETLLRRLVLEEGRYPKIKQFTGLVTGIRSDPTDPSRISEVFVCFEPENVVDIYASFVVDCSGTSHLGLLWLKDAGYEIPVISHSERTSDNIRIQYDQKLKVVTPKFKISTSLGERLPIPGGFQNTATIYNCLADWTLDSQNIYAQRVDGDFGKRYH
ncbi:hypothetical protein H2248_003948 [Termitomyces sp. 'cryptogamus']|nr:hypothetical protein H2248_003948 [Termitomyces sp. 'cryptogamus']